MGSCKRRIRRRRGTDDQNMEQERKRREWKGTRSSDKLKQREKK